jgi:hypothetical protein
VVGIAQIEAGNPFLSQFVGAEADSRHAAGGLALDRNAGSDLRAAARFGRAILQLSMRQVLPIRHYSLWAMSTPFSATGRFITSTKNATANVNTATIQKTSK